MSGGGQPRIAVVGMSGRFPGASDLDTFWDNLREGVESVTSFSDEELEASGILASVRRDPRCVKAAPVLQAIDLFDAGFFGMTVREAERVDPQQRILLECAWEALEQAGWSRARAKGLVGVYVGAGTSGYLDGRMEGMNVVTELENLLGNDKDYTATRLSYKLDLRGPAVTVQTACSTSLVAVHIACQALLAGECDLALAGGVRVRIPQKFGFLYQEGGLLSPDGRCRAFDAAANGTTFGSGAGVVVLKRLDDALADGNVVDAVILGSAVNNDGAAKVGFVAPGVDGQTAVISEALAVAGVDAATIGYVETHGTGTPLGDPIEITALTRAFHQRSKGKASCAIGSLKTSVGHLETAAGIAGFIKTVLALKHRQIPASLNFREPNPHIDFANSPFRVNTELSEWGAAGDCLRAGVSSFGIGGTNAHVVLEQAPLSAARPAAARARRVHVLPVSARGERSLRAQSERLALEIGRRGGEPGWLVDAALTAGAHRHHHPQRVCVVGETAAQLAGGLRGFARGESVPGVVSGSWAGGPRSVVFVYPGQGSQWIGMGRRLKDEPAFARRLGECDGALRGPAGFSVLEVLASDHEGAGWKRVDVIQPLLFALQVSLTAQWIDWGVKPDAVIGHSLGEVAASVVSGALSLEDGARVIGTRSRLVSRTCGRGRMALVELTWEQGQRELQNYAGVSIASHHGPETVLVSGGGPAVERLVADLGARGVFARLVDVDYASHSSEMDNLLGELRAALAGLQPRRPEIPFCSTLLGKMIDGEALDGDYWARNLREPVKFHDSIEKLLALGRELFVEVSPHPVLTPTLQRTLGTRGVAFGSTRRGGDEVRDLAESLARVHVNGGEVDWARREAGAGGRMVRLPAYAWTRQRYWLEEAGKRPVAAEQASGHPWLAQSFRTALEPGARIWQGELDVKRLPHLQEHRVQGVPVVAGAVWLEAAMHAARADGRPADLEDVEFTSLLSVDVSGSTTVQLVARESGFEVSSAPGGTAEKWTLHARGRLSPRPDPSGSAEAAEPPETLAAVRERCGSPVDAAAFYDVARRRGIDYGARYAGLRRLWVGSGEAAAELALTAAEPGRWEIEPWLLDACLQVLGATQSSDGEATYLPVRIGRLRADGALPERGWVHARCRPGAADELEGDVRLYAEDGRIVVEATGVVLRRASRRREEHEDWLFAIDWQAQDRQAAGAGSAPGSWMVVGDGALAGRVVRRLETAGARCMRAGAGLAGIERALAAAADCTAIAYLSPIDDEDGGVAAGASASSVEVMRLVQLLAEAGGREPPRLWIVTRGTQAIESDGEIPPRHAPLWGLARSLVHEHPELRPTCIDLPARCAEADLDALAAELSAGGAGEDSIALRAGRRFVARLVRTAPEPRRREVKAPAGARPFALETESPGTLEALDLREVARRAPGPAEVEIEVEAAGLNLLDVLLALGALPDDAPGGRPQSPRLGGECAGRIVRVGPGVDGFAAGDRVLALAPSAFRSHVVGLAGLTAHLPAGVSFEAGAGFPIAFLTAHLALRQAARLEPGERVLIHAASTGVGLAAVQLALLAGAEVFATAGSDAKRERLRALGVRHVMSSRSLEFARQTMEATAGEGVDVVLNSLSGQFIPYSLGVLRQHGRYVDIGKRDYYDDAKLGLRPFLKGISMSLVDLRGMLTSRPRAVESALAQLVGELASGRLRPLPVESFPARSAADAFRHVAQAKHGGKVVIAMRDPAAPIAPARREVRIRGDATYAITGGLGGLGLEAAKHLVASGARRLVLMGRRAPSAGAEAVLASLRAAGATVLVAQGDVARAEDVARVRAAAAGDPDAPLRGVIHAAGVLDDGILVKQTADRFAAVMAPKVAGAWNLHLATAGDPLDFFVLFSSLASILGAPAQASYAAGNAFLDALAHHRHAAGRPALSVNWGAWGEVGLAAAQDNRAKRVAGQGVRSLTSEQGIRALARLLSSPLPQVTVAPLNLRQWLESNPSAAQWKLLAALHEEPAAAAAQRSQVKDALGAARPGARRRMLEEHLAGEVAAVLRIPAEAVDHAKPLTTLGLDSLTALEFRNRLELSLGLALRATLIWAHPTIAGLAEFVAQQLGLELKAAERAAPEAPKPAVVEEVALAQQIDSLSDVEAEAELRGLLDVIEGGE